MTRRVKLYSVTGFSWLPVADVRRRFDGRAALDSLLQRAGFPTVLHAAAAFSAFHHPDTVAQSRGLPLFPVVRCKAMKEREKYVERNGRLVMLDDNFPPTYAFSIPARVSGCDDIQFNHLWPQSDDWRYYTALWNICPTPAFISKLTDSDAEVRSALRYRSFHLYGYLPEGSPLPNKPESYEELPWTEPFPAVTDLEGLYRSRLKNENNRVSRCARKCGWLYSDFQPDGLL